MKKVTREIPREETNGLMGQTDRKTTYEEGYKGIPREETNGLMGQIDKDNI